MLSKPLSRKLAIPLALAGMWVATVVGVYWYIASSPLGFIGLRGYDVTTIAQIGAIYLGWTGAQLTGAYIAGFVLASSDFTHPLRTTFWIMTCYHLFFGAIQAVRWPWTAIKGLDQSIPILAELFSRVLLIGAGVFFGSSGNRVGLS